MYVKRGGFFGCFAKKKGSFDKDHLFEGWYLTMQSRGGNVKLILGDSAAVEGEKQGLLLLRADEQVQGVKAIMRLSSFIVGWICTLALVTATSLWHGLPLGQVLLLIIMASLLSQVLYLGLVLLLTFENGRDRLNWSSKGRRFEDPAQLGTGAEITATSNRHVP